MRRGEAAEERRLLSGAGRFLKPLKALLLLLLLPLPSRLPLLLLPLLFPRLPLRLPPPPPSGNSLSPLVVR